MKYYYFKSTAKNELIGRIRKTSIYSIYIILIYIIYFYISYITIYIK